jgi:amino acid transporter
MKTKRSVKELLLGKALTSSQLNREKLSKIWGLPIMASDAVSSVAYAVEEILMALVPMIGLASVHFAGYVSIPIILLLLMLVFSYTQIINHYPNGGGSYIVSLENFGQRPAMLAASCLIIDYIMTVAVSISSSTAAIISAFPLLGLYKIPISLLSIALITLINLRGVSESSKVFGIPIYIFIFSMGIMIITGLIRIFTGNLAPIEYSQAQLTTMIPNTVVSGMTLLIFLHAFSSGCSALTGVEAVSNAIPSFKKPAQKTAKQVLFMLATIIIVIFGGTSFLATVLKVLPVAGSTVTSQMANAVFGQSFMFYLLQVTTSIILLFAANTAYSGLPILLSILAKDRYMPQQFSQRGTKLSFSNGIIFILIMASILLIVFDADTHKLIPFYSVGVFISFTISQAGMFMKWFRLKEPGWQYKSLINGAGAIVTFLGTIVVFVTKFTHGAWMLAIFIPCIMLFMARTHKHYSYVGEQIRLNKSEYKYRPSTNLGKIPCVVLISNMNKASLKTLDYAKEISSNIIALHVSSNKKSTESLKKQWKDFGIEIPLTILDAPYRNIIPPLDQYISECENELEAGVKLTVVLTKFVGIRWIDNIYHNQTTFFIIKRLSMHRKVITSLVPYSYQTIKNK